MASTWIEHFDKVWKDFKSRISQLGVGFFTREEVSVWEDLFIGKIVPHLEGEGCLVIAVAGGTNTGKSTILNVLMKKEITLTDPYATATKRPVLIASEKKAQQCLQNKWFLEFDAKLMENKEEATASHLPNNLLLVKVEPSLPDTYMYLDTPDIDSIAKKHWEIAEKIVSAGDMIIAVINDCKYKDEAVIQFFRRAYEEGKIIIPLMNKVDSDNPQLLQIAQQQVEDFMKEVGMDTHSPSFYFLRYPYNEPFLDKPIKPFASHLPELMEYIGSFPVYETKAQVMQRTIKRFKGEFRKWYRNQFLTQFNHLSNKLKDLENRLLQETIIQREFNPFLGIQLDKEIRGEIQKQIGFVKYFLLLTTSIFSGYIRERRELREKEKILEIEVKKNHDAMVEKCFTELIDSLIKADPLLGIESIDKNMKKRLHYINETRDSRIKSIVSKMETFLSTKPEWLQKEIERVVKEFLQSPDLKGIYLRRILSVLSSGIGIPILFLGLPWMGPWAEIITGLGLIGGTFILEIDGYRKFEKQIVTVLNRWINEKKEQLARLLKEEVLQYALEELYKYLEVAEEFNQQVNNIPDLEIEVNDVEQLPETLNSENMTKEEDELKQEVLNNEGERTSNKGQSEEIDHRKDTIQNEAW